MHPRHLIGLAFTVLCTAGLWFLWPYAVAMLRGTWLFDLRLVVLAVFVAVALSLLHKLETWAGTRFPAPEEPEH